MAKSDKPGCLGPIMLICFLAIVFINAPGMIVLGFVKTNLLTSLDIAQVWVFSVMVSLACLIILFAITRELRTAFVLYAGLCLVCVGICALLYFGFKVKFPSTYLNYFLDGSSYVPVK